MSSIFELHPLPWTVQELYAGEFYVFYVFDKLDKLVSLNINDMKELVSIVNDSQKKRSFAIQEINGLYLYKTNEHGGLFGSNASEARIFRRRCDATQCIAKNKMEGEFNVVSI